VVLILFGVASCTLTSTPILPDNTSTPIESIVTKLPVATSTESFYPTESELGSGSRPFIWDPFYGYLDLEQPDPFLTHPKGKIPKDKYPDNAVALGFSSYSDQIGYLLENRDGNLELWISDLLLTHPRLAWVDMNNELGYINKSIDQVFEIKWNLEDSFVYIFRYPTDNSDAEESFLFSLQDNRLLKLSSPSGYLLTSPETGQPVLANKTSDGFVLLELNGTYQEVQSLPANQIPILDSAFSPDREKVLYVSGKNIYLKINADVIDLNIGYVPVWHDVHQVILQWSQDGSRVLVYGVDLSGKYCLKERFGSLPCWQVIDGLTGNHLWWETEPTQAVTAISPDGKQVVEFMYIAGPNGLSGQPGGYVVDVDTGEYKVFIDMAYSAAHWSSK